MDVLIVLGTTRVTGSRDKTLEQIYEENELAEKNPTSVKRRTFVTVSNMKVKTTRPSWGTEEKLKRRVTSDDSTTVSHRGSERAWHKMVLRQQFTKVREEGGLDGETSFAVSGHEDEQVRHGEELAETKEMVKANRLGEKSGHRMVKGGESERGGREPIARRARLLVRNTGTGRIARRGHWGIERAERMRHERDQNKRKEATTGKQRLGGRAKTDIDERKGRGSERKKAERREPEKRCDARGEAERSGGGTTRQGANLKLIGQEWARSKTTGEGVGRGRSL